MARINLEMLRVEEDARNKSYVWMKELIINGRSITNVKRYAEEERS